MADEISWSRVETTWRKTGKYSYELATGRLKRPRGRPPQRTWHVTFAEDLQDIGVTWRDSSQRSEMEESRRPMFQQELVELSLSLQHKC